MENIFKEVSIVHVRQVADNYVLIALKNLYIQLH